MTPRDVDILFAQMKQLGDAHRYAEAIQIGQKLLTMVSTSDHIKRGNIYYNIGLDYNEMGRYDEAEDSYAISCREKPDDSDTWFNRANNHQRWGRQLLQAGNSPGARAHFQQALDYLRRAKQINPSDPDIDNLMSLVQRSL